MLCKKYKWLERLNTHTECVFYKYLFSALSNKLISISWLETGWIPSELRNLKLELSDFN